jgi:hypothetical protein
VACSLLLFSERDAVAFSIMVAFISVIVPVSFAFDGTIIPPQNEMPRKVD